MLDRQRFLCTLALGAAVAAGCGGGVESTGTGGAGGTGSSDSATTGTGTNTTAAGTPGSGSGSGSTSGSTASASGSTASASGSGSASSSASSGAGGGGAASCQPTEDTVLAINKIYFGEGANGEWKKFGFNIDGKVSSATSTDLCKPVTGGTAAKVYPDGDNGIDNSFGSNILPTLLKVAPTMPASSNQSIADGTFTMMIKLDGLPPTGDKSPLVAKLYGGTALGAPPKFDGTDCWPVAPELLSSTTDIESSKVVFGAASVKGNIFDAGKNNTFILTVPLATQAGSASITLTIHAAQVTLNLDEDRKGATGGIVGGVLDTDEFVAEFKKALNAIGACLFASALEAQVRAASDILKDGSQDPAQPCDGISIGLGFDMKQVGFGAVGPKSAQGTPCP